MTAPAWRADLAAICDDARREARTALDGPLGERDARSLVAAARRAAARMDRLRPPEELAPAHDRLVRATRRPALIAEDAGIDIANGGDPRAAVARARRRLKGALAEARRAADGAGVAACRPPANVPFVRP